MKYGKYKKQWRMLLSKKRFNSRNGKVPFLLQEPGPREGRTPFEADIGRVIFSQPFRRLAGKTQVHPFSSIDYVHNRLTHSNEVAYVSRALGRRAATFMLKETGDLEDERQIETIGWVCQAAGLMHDIGNPPYGHAGEDAIRAWARKNKAVFGQVCGLRVLNDFLHFDGNAQAFRMASRPGLRESSYFKFTAAALGALVKYPWATNDSKGKEKNKSAAFSTEEIILKLLMSELGLSKYQRHPLSYLTEAADDICYRINDFEDAVIMGLMDEREVKNLLLDGMEFSLSNQLRDESLSRVRALAIGDLIWEFSEVYKHGYNKIMAGTFEGDLKSQVSGKWGGVLERIKDKYDLIFSERRKVVTEIGAFGQFEVVLDKFFEYLQWAQKERKKGYFPAYKKLPFLHQRLVTLAWGGLDYYEKNRDKPIDWWAHAVLDFIVGMTDEYLHHISAEFM